jgi:hypothetical protein
MHMTTQSNKVLDICPFLCYNTGMKNEKSSNNLTVKVYSGSDGSLEKGTSRLTLSQTGVVVAPLSKECHATNLTVKVYSGSDSSLEKGMSRNQINAATRALMAEAVAIAQTTQELK